MEATEWTAPFGREVSEDIMENCYGLPTSEMKMAETYISKGWDFVNIWGIHPEVNDGYPYLQGMFPTPHPLMPVLVSPENNSENIPVDVVLKWDSTEKPNPNYRVYFGTENPPVYVGDVQNATSWTPGTVLEYETEYFWKIVPYNEVGEVDECPVWSFTTGVFVSNKDNVDIFKNALNGNYPNPFNPETIIKFSLEKESLVSIEIYNIRGARVKTLVKGVMNRGNHNIKWNGVDDLGKPVGSGLYLYRMKTGEYVDVKKMLLLK
jgi:hypothetical protein